MHGIILEGRWTLVLTDRELEVPALVTQRLSSKATGGMLAMPPATINRHTVHKYQKLGVNTRREAIARAGTLGIIQIQH
jgi:LuxR family maltose regulon positive regulatory protein